jgi:hypothetical protein
MVGQALRLLALSALNGPLGPKLDMHMLQLHLKAGRKLTRGVRKSQLQPIRPTKNAHESAQECKTDPGLRFARGQDQADYVSWPLGPGYVERDRDLESSSRHRLPSHRQLAGSASDLAVRRATRAPGLAHTAAPSRSMGAENEPPRNVDVVGLKLSPGRLVESGAHG